MFVKPSNQGSSVGVNHVTNADEYAAALEEAFKYDDKVLIEETVPGTEVETAVLGNDKPIVAGVGQITNAKGSFYTYETSTMTTQLLSCKFQQTCQMKLLIQLERMLARFTKLLNVAVWLESTQCLPQVARLF